MPDESHADAGTSSPTLLTAVPANGMMANVTAFVDATNIAQYTSSQVSNAGPPSTTPPATCQIPLAGCTAVCPIRVPCADPPS